MLMPSEKQVFPAVVDRNDLVHAPAWLGGERPIDAWTCSETASGLGQSVLWLFHGLAKRCRGLDPRVDATLERRRAPQAGSCRFTRVLA